MKRLVLILTIAAGVGIGLAIGRMAVGPVTADEPQPRRQELALGRLAYHEEFGGPAIVAVHHFTFDPGARAGWHTHPGPAWIVVSKGEMAFYDADGCRTVYPAGSAVMEQAGRVHEPRNETTEPLEFYVTFVVPPGPALRSAAEAPVAECGDVVASQPPSNTTRYTTRGDVIPQEGPLEVIQSIIDFPPGAASSVHYHSGTAHNTVIAGEITLRHAGSERRIGVGQAWTDAPGIVHQAVNLGGAPATVAAVFVQPKGAMATVPVPSLESPGPTR